jgi:hypothetical protein
MAPSQKLAALIRTFHPCKVVTLSDGQLVVRSALTFSFMKVFSEVTGALQDGRSRSPGASGLDSTKALLGLGHSGQRGTPFAKRIDDFDEVSGSRLRLIE